MFGVMKYFPEPATQAYVLWKQVFLKFLENKQESTPGGVVL